jgi:hypothetical protein
MAADYDADVMAQTALHFVGTLLSDEPTKSRPVRLEFREEDEPCVGKALLKDV